MIVVVDSHTIENYEIVEPIFIERNRTCSTYKVLYNQSMNFRKFFYEFIEKKAIYNAYYRIMLIVLIIEISFHRNPFFHIE